MKPAPFAYSAPASVADAIGLLDIYEDDAKVIAGGQSLAPMLNMRLARPANLIDLRKLRPELGYIADEGSQVRIGALTRHADVERFAFAGAPALLSKAAPYIGHPSIRSRGTIGGSVAHEDPAAEFPTALTAHIETPTELNELGIKGLGEGGAIGGHAAVANAVADALGDTSRPTATPMTPERMWQLLQASLGNTQEGHHHA